MTARPLAAPVEPQLVLVPLPPRRPLPPPLPPRRPAGLGVATADVREPARPTVARAAKGERASVNVHAGTCVFDMNNFIGTCTGNVGAGLRVPVTNNVSVGLTAERNRYQLTKFGYDGRGSVTSERAIVDARYTFGAPADVVRPYLEAGVGHARVTSRFEAAPTPELAGTRYRMPRTSDSDWLGHLAAGATVALTDRVRLDLAGTYQITDNLRFPICLTPPGGSERCDNQSAEGKLLRTTGYERNYGLRIGISVALP